CTSHWNQWNEHSLTLYIPSAERLTGLAPGTWVVARLHYLDAQNRPVDRYSNYFRYDGGGQWSWFHPLRKQWEAYLTPYWKRVLEYFPSENVWYEGVNVDSLDFTYPEYALLSFEVDPTDSGAAPSRTYYVGLHYGTLVNGQRSWQFKW